jgi:glycolate oxidase iron-sulfur subunit
MRPRMPAVDGATLSRRAGIVAALRKIVPGEGVIDDLDGLRPYESDGARRNVDAWSREIARHGLDAIVVTASGCGTAIKDYGFLLRDDPAYADKAKTISALARDVSEFLLEADLPAGNGRGVTVAYHAACSLQHGQKITEAPRRLLTRAGYEVRTPLEAHLCCGSAGAYNILQPVIADQLGDRKVASLEQLRADIIATGNIGCALQIGQRAKAPVVHTIELLDWATGGPAPAALSPSSQRAVA